MLQTNLNQGTCSTTYAKIIRTWILPCSRISLREYLKNIPKSWKLGKRLWWVSIARKLNFLDKVTVLKADRVEFSDVAPSKVLMQETSFCFTSIYSVFSHLKSYIRDDKMDARSILDVDIDCMQ